MSLLVFTGAPVAPLTDDCHGHVCKLETQDRGGGGAGKFTQTLRNSVLSWANHPWFWKKLYSRRPAQRWSNKICQDDNLPHLKAEATKAIVRRLSGPTSQVRHQRVTAGAWGMASRSLGEDQIALPHDFDRYCPAYFNSPCFCLKLPPVHEY